MPVIEDVSEFLKSLVGDGDCIELWQEDDPIACEGGITIHTGFGSAPREANELLRHSLDVLHDVTTSTMDDESAPVESAVAGYATLDFAEDLEDLKGIDLEGAKVVHIGFAGHHNCPSYCDDECDASFSGSFYVSTNSDWVADRVNKEQTKSLEAALAAAISGAGSYIEELRQLGRNDPLCIPEAQNLMRKLIRA